MKCRGMWSGYVAECWCWCLVGWALGACMTFPGRACVLLSMVVWFIVRPLPVDECVVVLPQRLAPYWADLRPASVWGCFT